MIQNLYYSVRSRRDIVGMEPTLEHQSAGDVPMQRLDMLLALCRANIGGEMMQRLSQIDPLANA